MTNERLIYLFERYQQQLLTEPEKAEWQQVLADESYEEQVKALMGDHFPDVLPNYPMQEGAAQDILNVILQTPLPQATTVVRRVRKVRYRAWWAAAAVLAAGLTTLYFVNRFNVQPPPVATVVKTVKPGSNKAILTLADGSSVTLDSTGKRVIQQGATAIQQQGGRLHYIAQANSNANISYNILTVPRGGQFQVVLPDGTKVWLNAASRLRYPTAFIGKERVVELEGQGYFEVAQNAAQPFKVKVQQMEVAVLGTSFDIMAYTDEQSIHTTLVTGAVMVSNGAQHKTLQPGQQAQWNKQVGMLNVKAADVDKALAWKSGFFELDNTDLPAILRQLARWYDVEIIDRTAGNSSGLFGGRISRNVDLLDVLHVLERYGVRSRVEGKKVTILP